MTTCQGIEVYPYHFLRILTISWHIQAPINFYVFYCIIFLSPKAMKSFRWHLFVYHCSTTFLDFTLAMGMTPVVIPALALGYSVGLYRNFLDCHQLLTLSLICMTISASATVEIFSWRWQNMLLPSSRLKLGMAVYYGIWAIVLSSLIFCIALIHYHVESDQLLLKNLLKQTYSCVDFFFEQPGVWVGEAVKYLSVVVYGIISCCIGAFFLLLFVQQSLSAINKLAAQRSAYARHVQKKLLYFLIAQMTFPLAAYAVGGTTIILSLWLQLAWMQQGFNVAILIFSNYGLAASICLIACNEPYLRQTKRLLTFRKFLVMNIRLGKKGSAVVRVS